jgi:hypothetical protein
MDMDISKNIVCVTLYYDKYEAYYGDGLYPQLTKATPCTKEVIISFSLDNQNYWRQKSDDDNQGICGLDGDIGHLLLVKINELAVQQNINAGIGIKNKYDLVIYPNKN